MSGIKIENGKLSYGIDTDKDGVDSVKAELILGEMLQEAFEKGEAKVDVKSFTAKFEGSKLILIVDTDKDGENSFVTEIDMIESFDEVSKKLSKE